MADETLISSLRRAVEAVPNDAGLRLHLAEVLAHGGLVGEAVTEAATVLQLDPGSAAARDLIVRLTTPPAEAASAPGVSAPATPPPGSSTGHGVDWKALEDQVGDIAEPMFVEHDDADAPGEDAYEVQTSTVRLADVGGMEQVKARLESAFLAPLRNEGLRKLYGKSLRGGLLLYGPPGCGKTFIARAVAGELGAGFISIGISDVLDMYLGNSERNVHEIFVAARRHAPVVLFFDELDSIGQKRSQTRGSAARGVINQLLLELDGVDADNEGVFVLGATNQPWDIDPALRRPGRLDRMLLVLPPDEPARQAVFRTHLADRPVEGVDLKRLAKASAGYSGADIAHVCESASESALMDSVRTGQARMIRMTDLESALTDVRPSTGPWFATARNVVEFGDPDNSYDELRRYMRKNRLM